MTAQDLKFWRDAADAQQTLHEQYSENPHVAYVDIGYPPQNCDYSEQAVLRIHVTANLAEGELSVPSEQNGVPICLVRDNR